MKLLIILCLIASLATIAWTSSASWGSPSPYDKVVLNETVIRFPIYGHVQSVTVKFPKDGQGNFKTITAIRAVDGVRNGTGAQPSLWAGGVGYISATVNFKTQVGKGMNSTLIIFVR